MVIKFTKKEREEREKQFKFIREFKPRKKGKELQIFATDRFGRRVPVEVGFRKLSVAKKSLNKLKKNKEKLKKLGLPFKNLRIKRIKRR